MDAEFERAYSDNVLYKRFIESISLGSIDYDELIHFLLRFYWQQFLKVIREGHETLSIPLGYFYLFEPGKEPKFEKLLWEIENVDSLAYGKGVKVAIISEINSEISAPSTEENLKFYIVKLIISLSS